MVTGGLSLGDYVYDVACMQDRSVVITGEVWGVSNRESEVFLTRYNTNGALLWTRTAGGLHSDRGLRVAIKQDFILPGGPPVERIEVRGSGFGCLRFSTPTATIDRTLDDELGFIAKYDQAGKILSVTTDSFDKLNFPRRKAEYLKREGAVESGWFDYAMPFPSQALTSAGGRDAYLAEFAPNGSLTWAVPLGGPRTDWATAVTFVPGESACVVVGMFEGTVSFPDSILDPDSLPEIRTASGDQPDVFVAKFTLKDSDGDGTSDLKEHASAP